MPNGASACPMAVFSGFYESPGPPPSGDVRVLVPAHRHIHRNVQQSEYILHCSYFICCRPGGRQGNTEQVVARWRHPVASGIALDMLHRTMLSLLHCCTAMAIEMAIDRATFVCLCHLF